MLTRRRRNWCGRMLAALVAICIGSTIAMAQAAGGRFVGKVTDQSAGTLPYARVDITNLATGLKTSVVTNEDGLFSAPNLQPGKYDITAAFDGFKTQTRTGLTLTVGAEVAADFEMQLGEISENVTVSGQSARVDTVSAAIRHNVSGTTIRELPLNGRDWTQLAMLQPGVVGVGASGGTRSGNGTKMAVAGARPSENNYRLNGIGVNDSPIPRRETRSAPTSGSKRSPSSLS
jgi:hypothetical protein